MPRKLCRSAAKPCGEIELQGEKIAERAEAVVARADQLIRFDGAERAQLARKEHLEGGEHDAVAAGFEPRMRSTTPSSYRSAAVIFRHSAASATLAGSFQRIEAQPSGEMTE